MARRTTAKPKRMSIEDLAVITSRGFEHVDKRFEHVEGRFTKLEQKVNDGFRHVNERLDQIRRDIADLDDLRERVFHLEELLKVQL